MCAFKNYCKSLAKCKCISNDMPLSPTDMIGDTPVPVCTCLVNYLVRYYSIFLAATSLKFAWCIKCIQNFPLVLNHPSVSSIDL